MSIDEQPLRSLGSKLVTRVAVLEERCRGLETRCKDLDSKVDDMHQSVDKKFESISNWIRGIMGGIIVALIMLIINLFLKK